MHCPLFRGEVIRREEGENETNNAESLEKEVSNKCGQTRRRSGQKKEIGRGSESVGSTPWGGLVVNCATSRGESGDT